MPLVNSGAVFKKKLHISYHRALMVTHQGCPQTPGGRIRALGFARMGARGRRRGPIPAMCQYQGSPVSYHRALMVTHQGCPQTPGGRIRALGFARMGARGRRRGPIPAMCQYQGSPVSPAHPLAADERPLIRRNHRAWIQPHQSPLHLDERTRLHTSMIREIVKTSFPIIPSSRDIVGSRIGLFA
jgi:hypothetical protein